MRCSRGFEPRVISGKATAWWKESIEGANVVLRNLDPEVAQRISTAGSQITVKRSGLRAQVGTQATPAGLFRCPPALTGHSGPTGEY